MSRRKPLSDVEREERRQRDRERLQAAARELQGSEGWKRWVKVRRSNGLARYSVNNTMLIAMQAWAKRIEPSYVCGYRRWSELGYQVRKGEKAIAILGPIRAWVEDEATGERVKRVVGFKAVPVFDIAQVEAGPEAVSLAPSPAAPLTGHSHAPLLPELVAFAESIGSEVSFERPDSPAQGSFNRKTREIRIAWAAPNGEVRTLLHELAHALVQLEREGDDELPAFSYAEEECVVECAGYVAASAAGLDTSGEAVAYVAGWGETDKLAVVTAAAGLIDTIARRLEQAIAIEDQEVVDAATAQR